MRIKRFYASTRYSGHHRRKVDHLWESKLMSCEIFPCEAMMLEVGINKILDEGTSLFFIELSPDPNCNSGQFAQRILKKLTITYKENVIAQKGHQCPIVNVGKQKTVLPLHAIPCMK